MYYLRRMQESHIENKAENFNNDEKFKYMIDEAITCKSFARKKLEMYAKYLRVYVEGPEAIKYGHEYSEAIKYSKEDLKAILDRIVNCAIQYFSSADCEDEIITDCFEFPWGSLREQRALVNLGSWHPTLLKSDQKKLDKCSESLKNNKDLRTIRLGSNSQHVDLDLSDAWNTKEVIWESKAQSIPWSNEFYWSSRFFVDIVVLLLKNCRNLTILSLR